MDKNIDEKQEWLDDWGERFSKEFARAVYQSNAIAAFANSGFHTQTNMQAQLEGSGRRIGKLIQELIEKVGGDGQDKSVL